MGGTTVNKYEAAGGLSGLTCLELGNFISSAYCTKLMADVGMEVIKLEEPGKGDVSRYYGPFPDDRVDPEQSGMFWYLNCNKLGITLNLSDTAGRDVFKRIIAQVDIIVENHPPGFWDEIGLTYEILAGINPGLVMTSITPFGQTGPYRDYRAYPLNCAAAGGISGIIGEPSREPLSPPLSLGQYQSGAVAATATLVALIKRRTNNIGQHLDVSEVDVWATLHTGLMTHRYVFQGAKRNRAGHRSPGFYPYTILPCKDGYVSMIALLGSQWKRFLELMGGGTVPDWYTESGRFDDRWVNGREHADELDQLLAPWLMAHGKEEIFSMCQERHIPFAPVRSIDEVAGDEHLSARGYFVEVNQPSGRLIRLPGAPCKFSKTEWNLRRFAPKLGEHNEEVFCSRLGYSTDELKNMQQAGII